MVYLPTFTIKEKKMYVNIPYMDSVGFVVKFESRKLNLCLNQPAPAAPQCINSSHLNREPQKTGETFVAHVQIYHP